MKISRQYPINAFNSVLKNAILEAPREYKGSVKSKEPIYVNPQHITD
jgi:hypothetical protein